MSSRPLANATNYFQMDLIVFITLKLVSVKLKFEMSFECCCGSCIYTSFREKIPNVTKVTKLFNRKSSKLDLFGFFP